MGLDMWLRVKTKLNVSDTNTGVCSGLFGIVPETKGEQEIGYWRNAYDQRALILEYVDNYDNGLISKEGVDEILEKAKEILETHTFDEEDGYDMTESEDLWGSLLLCGTWNCKSKWEDTIEFFTKAKEILEQDENAKIHYLEWQ